MFGLIRPCFTSARCQSESVSAASSAQSRQLVAGGIVHGRFGTSMSATPRHSAVDLQVFGKAAEQRLALEPVGVGDQLWS